jgi:hypothetical protein
MDGGIGRDGCYDRGHARVAPARGVGRGVGRDAGRDVSSEREEVAVTVEGGGRQDGLITHRGGCHCGAVRYEVRAPARVVARECNCSICHMLGFQHLIVERSCFTLLQGEHSQSLYTFNTGVAQHYFCQTCGVKSWYVPRSHPDGVSVNVRTLDDDPRRQVELQPFDGRHWERHVHQIR